MTTTTHPMADKPVGQLLRQFAVPSIIAMLVSSLYNIIDQLFIGQSIGLLGNAATNIAFPLTPTCVAFSLMFGIGGAARFNLAMGAGRKKEAAAYMGNALQMLVSCGIVLCIIVRLFLTPMLLLFGATDQVLDYARTYTGITSLGFPFLILATGGGHLIRADGSPQFSMICNLVGAIVNTVLDALFIFGFHMGAGAAYATIIGQIISALLVIRYMCHFKTVPLHLSELKPKADYIMHIVLLGTSPFINQIAMMIVQVVMNNSLSYYGALSSYGSEIPLACSGIIAKVNMVLFSMIIGISQGMQPIASYNYGAGNYGRVRKVLNLALKAGFVISIISFLLFQFLPRQIISLFGSGSEDYFTFAEEYFRIYLFFTFVNCLQPIASNFFTAVGKAQKGIILSLTRQILFLLPLIILLPHLMGIDGIMPIHALIRAAVLLSIYLVVKK
ncbi:MAG: MATE family efflux transporter [Coprococcus sp.]